MIFTFEDCKIKTVSDLENHAKKIEEQIRRSKEYRCWLRYLKEDCQMRFSQTWNKIDFVDKKLTLEIHHLITLYDLVMIIGGDMIANLKDGEYFLSFDISKAVIEAHLDDLIPVVSLAKTEHELQHANLFKIDPKKAQIHLGNYKDFIDKYNDYLTEKDYKMYLDLGADKEYINEKQNAQNRSK